MDTAEALFEVDDYEDFVHVQSESALRNLATPLPLRQREITRSPSRGNTAEISRQLRGDIQERWTQAGVEVIEARISHLAYAPEIAAAMLQRQQASAVVAARSKIVEGAVGMVEMALDMLAARRIVELDDERKAAMVSQPPGRAVRRPPHAAGGQHRLALSLGESVRGRAQELPAADRPGGLDAAPALGRRRAAERQRADRVPAPRALRDAGRCAAKAGSGAEGAKGKW